MRRHVGAWPERTWAVEGSNVAGRPLAQRLLPDGEHVVDVPAKLAARVWMLDTGHGRKYVTWHCGVYGSLCEPEDLRGDRPLRSSRGERRPAARCD